jgi:hypothetical protein
MEKVTRNEQLPRPADTGERVRRRGQWEGPETGGESGQAGWSTTRVRGAAAAAAACPSVPRARIRT